jgi:hypothetical protein
MSPHELNPNHPVVREMREQYHKLLAIVMADHGLDEFDVTVEMIDDFSRIYGEGAAVVVDTRGGGLKLRLVRGDEAARLARQEGGLPV